MKYSFNITTNINFMGQRRPATLEITTNMPLRDGIEIESWLRSGAINLYDLEQFGEAIEIAMWNVQFRREAKRKRSIDCARKALRELGDELVLLEIAPTYKIQPRHDRNGVSWCYKMERRY